MKPHIKLIAEIKRDHRNAGTVRETQVYPALDFLPDISAFGFYWDDVEQRLFYRTIHDTRTKTHEAPIALLPISGHALGSTVLRRRDLHTSNTLRTLFDKIEDRVHTQVPDKSRRFEIMLQLLLVKLYDEHIRGRIALCGALCQAGAPRRANRHYSAERVPGESKPPLPCIS